MLNLKKYLILLLAVLNVYSISTLAITTSNEIDSIRAYLVNQKDKTSQEYIKNKEKLNRLIIQSNIDYSTQARFKDINRLINEQKYNSAIYELKDLIENNIEVSKSQEYLGDIYSITSQNTSKAAKYYKKAVVADDNNISAMYKLSKLYLKEEKNILGCELLKRVIESSKTNEYFPEIENMILNNAHPNNKYEANNFYEALGLLYLKSGRSQEGYRAYLKALELNSDDINLRYQLANLLYMDNQADNAIKVYDSILKYIPYDSQIRNSKAKLYYKKGNILSAEQEYIQILAQYPDSNQAKYGIYQLYKNSLPIEKIIQKFYTDKYIQTPKPEEIQSFIDFLNEIHDYDAATCFIKYKEKLLNNKNAVQVQEKTYKKEQLEIAQLKKADKFEAEEQSNKETITKKIKKQEQNKLKKMRLEKERIEKFEEQKTKQQQENKNTKDIKTKPQNPQDLINEQLEYDNMQKRKQEALEKELQKKRIQEQQLIEKIQKQQKNDKESQDKELLNFKNNKNYNQFKTKIDEYLKTTPITTSVYIAVANTYKQANMPYNAIKYFNEAKKLEPTNSDIYYDIALTYMELNRLEESKDNLDKAINFNKDNKKAQTLYAFVSQKLATSIINNAYSDFENKKYIEAYSKLEKGIKQLPQNAQLYYYRALVTDAMNRNAAAIIDFQKAIELDPSYYMSYYYLGKSYEKINDFKSALVAYERFLSTEPDEKELIDEIQKKVIILGKKYY